MNTTHKNRSQELINAVRNDRVVGRGTGSHIDQWTDIGLRRKLTAAGIKAPRNARSWCRRQHEAEVRKAKLAAAAPYWLW
jgi:hypothetical protein